MFDPEYSVSHAVRTRLTTMAGILGLTFYSGESAITLELARRDNPCRRTFSSTSPPKFSNMHSASRVKTSPLSAISDCGATFTIEKSVSLIDAVTLQVTSRSTLPCTYAQVLTPERHNPAVCTYYAQYYMRPQSVNKKIDLRIFASAPSPGGALFNLQTWTHRGASSVENPCSRTSFPLRRPQPNGECLAGSSGNHGLCPPSMGG